MTANLAVSLVPFSTYLLQAMATFLGESSAFLYHSLFMLRGVKPMTRFALYNTCIV